MKFRILYAFLVLCCICSSLFPSIAQSQVIADTPIWRSSINTQSRQIIISGQEDNFTLSLYILSERPSLLRISFVPNNKIRNITFVNFTIGKQIFTLAKQLNKNNFIEFEVVLSNSQLKTFIQKFTSTEQATITIDHKEIPISLTGTTSLISTLLEHLNTHPMPKLAPPFGKVTPSNSSSLANTNNATGSYSQLLYGMGGVFFLLLFGRPLFKLLSRIHRYRKKSYGIKKAYKIASNEIEQHAKTLYIKRDQLLYKDDYGSLVQEKWIQEANRFIRTKIKPLLSENQVLDYYPLIQNKILKKVLYTAKYPPNKQRAFFTRRKKTKLKYSPTMPPLEYEEYCAELLRQAGWNADVTTASGDQGADVIASKKGMTLIIQCKLYSKPVSNKAVQEVNAAKIFYHAHYAAVVSNADYTTSARQLASSVKVTLLHHENLQKFANTLV